MELSQPDFHSLILTAKHARRGGFGAHLARRCGRFFFTHWSMLTGLGRHAVELVLPQIFQRLVSVAFHSGRDAQALHFMSDLSTASHSQPFNLPRLVPGCSAVLFPMVVTGAHGLDPPLCWFNDALVLDEPPDFLCLSTLPCAVSQCTSHGGFSDSSTTSFRYGIAARDALPVAERLCKPVNVVDVGAVNFHGSDMQPVYFALFGFHVFGLGFLTSMVTPSFHESTDKTHAGPAHCTFCGGAAVPDRCI